jgi:hypothetical protein
MMIDRKTYIRMGAEARLREIEAELDSIWRMFPELRNSHRTLGQNVAVPAARARKRRPMTAAQRKAVSGWMRRYWAKRRAAKGQSGASKRAR